MIRFAYRMRDIILAENEFVWNYNPGQPRDALGRWTGVGADYTFIEKKALGLLSTEQIHSYVRGKYPGKPKVVDGETFDNTDGIDIFRGVDNVAQAVDYVKSNKHFSTNEMQGITGHDFHEDFEVAKANRDAEAKIKRKYVVIQARLDTTRMTTYENLVQERNDYCPEQDLTTFAVDKGYSAVKIQNGTVVVLDKTATTVFDASLREYDDETFNNRKNNMNRIERLNNILERFENFNPYHGPDGRFTTGPGGAKSKGTSGADKDKTSKGKSIKTREERQWEKNNIGAGGVPGDSVPDKVPEITCPDKKARGVYEKYADIYNDPKKQKQAVDYLLNNTYGKGTFEVDGAKEALTERKTTDYKEINKLKQKAQDALTAFANGDKLTTRQKEALDKYYKAVADNYVSGWGSKTEMEALKYCKENGVEGAAQKLSGMMELQQKYNTAVHGTAVCLAKKALETKVEQMRANGEKVNIFMTAGGCASGKGYGLEVYQGKTKGDFTGDPKLVAEYKESAKKANIIWDAAGDQNSTEIKWLKDKSDSLTVSIVGNVDPNKVAANASRGLVSRAAKKGRMVDADVYANSYNVGAENLKVAMQLWGNEVKFVAYDGSKFGEVNVIPASKAKQLSADLKEIRSDINKKLSDVDFVESLHLSQVGIENISYGANFTLNSK